MATPTGTVVVHRQQQPSRRATFDANGNYTLTVAALGQRGAIPCRSIILGIPTSSGS